MTDTATVKTINCASIELEGALNWFEHEVGVCRSMDPDGDDGETESICFRRLNGMDLTKFMQRLKLVQHLLRTAGGKADG